MFTDWSLLSVPLPVLPMSRVPQAHVAASRDRVMTLGGLPGVGNIMGDTSSVFEAICVRADTNFAIDSEWPTTPADRTDVVLQTRQALGMDWTRRVTCYIDRHDERPILPSTSARWRNPTVFMVPHGAPREMQDALDEVFAGGSCFDFSTPGPAVCPWCREMPIVDCAWEFTNWTADNAPERLLLSSAAVDNDAAPGVPPNASQSILMGVEYTLVSVVYHIHGGCHFVTQFRRRGFWFKYDCLNGGATTSAPSFDQNWYHGLQVLYVYLQTSLLQ